MLINLAKATQKFTRTKLILERNPAQEMLVALNLCLNLHR